MRTAFSETLVHLAKIDPNVLLLTGDHGYALFDLFRKECPDQYINAGIAEQNMVGMAAGLARTGFRPFVYGLSAFIPIRVLEQIKLDVAHDSLPVIFIGDGAGFVYSHLGTSHQSTEDIACTRAVPNLAVYSPADRFEMTACMQLAYAEKMPVYIRMGKSDRGDIHPAPLSIKAGDVIKIKSGRRYDMAFLATGSMLKTAVRIAAKPDFNVSVYSVPFIKPIDQDRVSKICKSHRIVVVMEEHSLMGGLGSVISELASELAPTRILRIGINDRFSHHCGDYDYLLAEHHLDQNNIEIRITSYISSIN